MKELKGSCKTLIKPPIIALGLTGFASAQAIECGDTLGPDGVFKLNKDLVCETSPALTVLSGTTLDLMGHAITCAIQGTGIQLEGKHADVFNGEITSCAIGVQVGGEGNHLVKKMNARDNTVGYLVQSDGNLLMFNSVTESSDVAFAVEGAHNQLLHNTATYNFGIGFSIQGNYNLLMRNISDRGHTFAFQINGDNNRLVRNDAIETSSVKSVSFDVAGSHNRLTRNAAVANQGESFRTSSEGKNWLVRNLAEDNTFDINELASGNILMHNMVGDN